MISPTLELSAQDKEILDGRDGPGAAMALRIVARMAPLYGARRLLDIAAAHIDSSVYMGPSTLAFAERLVELGARVRVPSTLNVAGVDEHGWSEWPVPKDWAEGSRRQMDAYRSMGCIQTWTCAPYQTHHRPEFGQQIASGESNVIAFYNSVIGARTERYPDLLDICAAISGRAPAAGLHLTENRAATVLFDFSAIPLSVQQDEAFWPTLGNLVGTAAPNKVTALDGIGVRPTEDALKALAAGAASYGAAALFHIVGVTPEAPTRSAAFQGKEPAQIYKVTMRQLRSARAALSTQESDTLDVVLLGSPHFSVDEFRRFAVMANGQRADPRVKVIITCSRMVREIVSRTDVWPVVESFGARITVDSCPLVSPMLTREKRSIMTNSAKYAFYSPGLLSAGVRFGTLRDCIESAVRGCVVVDDSGWGLGDAL